MDDEIGLLFSDDPNNKQWSIDAQSGQGTVFEYDVISLGPLIHDNTLAMGFAGIGDTDGLTSSTIITIEERVLNGAGNQLAYKKVFWDITATFPNDTTDHAVFAPQSMITVNTDIGLITDPNRPNAYAHLNGFTQTFSQQMPEPFTILLFGSGLIGIGVVRKKFRK